MSERQHVDWAAFAKSLDGMAVVTDPQVVRVKSRDFYWFSPVLRSRLDDKVGDLLVSPRSEEEVIRVAQACARWRVPLTVRGAGTGNYGQAIPLRGGVILETTAMKAVRWLRPGLARVEAGIKLVDLDAEARKIGWEIRMYPSTKKTATVGGFVGGGSGGVGSITYGQLRDRGNVNAVRIVTVEEEPRVIELRGDAVHKASHAWGTNGIITELEIPLGAASPWIDTLVTFPDFMAAVRFSQALGESDGLLKKLITPMAWPITQYFKRLAGIPEGAHSVMTMVAEPSIEAFDELVREHEGRQVYRAPAEDFDRTPPLYEYTWNHTTLHAIKLDPAITYLQAIFPPDRNLELVEHLYRHFGDEVMMHLEFMRIGGRVTCIGLPLVRFTTEARLDEIMRYHEDHGVAIANPHTYILEQGGRKVVDAAQVEFKRQVDPFGLLNPGKIRIGRDAGPGGDP
jgi:FAD/FMN-containing dehydrogenase